MFFFFLIYLIYTLRHFLITLEQVGEITKYFFKMKYNYKDILILLVDNE